jgi:hypothetical protein
MRRQILSERNLVVVLFVMVLVIFSLAQEDTRKIEKMYPVSNSSVVSSVDPAENPEAAGLKTTAVKHIIPAAQLR